MLSLNKLDKSVVRVPGIFLSHNLFPVFASRQIPTTSVPISESLSILSCEVTKIRPFEMIGVPCPVLGMGVRQRIFSSIDTLNESTALPLTVKSPFGPNA